MYVIYIIKTLTGYIKQFIHIQTFIIFDIIHIET